MTAPERAAARRPPRTPCARRRTTTHGGPTPASPWSRSAATAAASWRRTPTSTSCWCTTTASTPGPLAEQVWYPLWDSGANARPLGALAARDGRPRPTATSGSRSACSTCGTWPATPTSPCGCGPRCSPAGAATPGAGCPELQRLVAPAPRADGRAGPRLGARPQGGRRAGCATRPCSRRWSPPGWSTSRTSSSSAAGWRCSTCATWCTGSAGRATDRVGPGGWARRSPTALGLRRRPRRPGARARARPPDHPPVPADLAPGRRRAGPPDARCGARRPDADAAGARASRSRRGEVVLDRGRPGRPRTRCCCCAPPPRPPSATSCWRPPPPPAWSASARRCPSRGPTRPASCWSGCSPPAAACCRSGRRSRRPARSTRILPEWERIRLLPHASVDPPLHRRPARRRDLHRGVRADPHGRPPRRADGRRAAARHRQGRAHRAQRRRGADRPARSPTRMGFDEVEADLIAPLVRWHLLLAETATTRDPDDPATVELVTARLGSAEALDAARGAHRGRRPGRLGQGVVVVAGRAGAPAGRALPGRARAGARTPSPDLRARGDGPAGAPRRPDRRGGDGRARPPTAPGSP